MKNEKTTSATAAKIAALQQMKTTGEPCDYKAFLQAAEAGTIKDDENPVLLFSTTWTSLLSQIAKGEIDAQQLARFELANRGLDLEGNWIGFKAAKAAYKN